MVSHAKFDFKWNILRGSADDLLLLSWQMQNIEASDGVQNVIKALDGIILYHFYYNSGQNVFRVCRLCWETLKEKKISLWFQGKIMIFFKYSFCYSNLTKCNT